MSKSLFCYILLVFLSLSMNAKGANDANDNTIVEFTTSTQNTSKKFDFTETFYPRKKSNPFFALKTNLLFDAATVLNVEAEVPIGKKWSVTGEWIFPWWITKNNGNALQILSANVDAKYWLGKLPRPVMTGWFVGLYAGGGLYDLQYKNNGYQGEFYMAAGFSGGYAHFINKSGSLRMEYSIGLGYLNTKYRYYEGKENNKYLVWQHNGRYMWLGPTEAKISLVWMFHKPGSLYLE